MSKVELDLKDKMDRTKYSRKGKVDELQKFKSTMPAGSYVLDKGKLIANLKDEAMKKRKEKKEVKDVSRK